MAPHPDGAIKLSPCHTMFLFSATDVFADTDGEEYLGFTTWCQIDNGNMAPKLHVRMQLEQPHLGTEKGQHSPLSYESL
eukprot:1700723-Amphidinium_carterae.1